MIGFLLALNAILLTVPERRRFIAELRMQGYDPRQVLLLLGFQALVLGMVASLVGVALGDALARAFFQRVPGFLTAAFPVGTAEAIHASTVMLAVGCGVLATMLASLAPLLDLRRGRPADAVFREAGARSEIVQERTIASARPRGHGAGRGGGSADAAGTGSDDRRRRGAGAGVHLLDPGRVRGRRALAAPRGRTRPQRRADRRALGAARDHDAVGRARRDRRCSRSMAASRSAARATTCWVVSRGRPTSTSPRPTSGSRRAATCSTRTTSPPPRRPRRSRAPRESPRCASTRGACSTSGSAACGCAPARRATARCSNPASCCKGDYATATRLIRGGGWAAVSSDYASERHLRVGSALSLPTPSGPASLRVAAILTNSGWPAGAITLSSGDYRRWWQTSDAAALEVSLRPGVSPAQGRRAARAALYGHPGLQVRTAAERAAQSVSSARQGLRTLRRDLDAAADRRRAGGRLGAQRHDLAAPRAPGGAEAPGL